MNQARVNEVFERMLAIPADQRAAVLDRECGGDAELRRAVGMLLDALSRAGDFMSGPAATVTSGATADQRDLSVLGGLIGPYKILEQIGEGGFGTVYMAEQTAPIRRRVALKVLKPGMDSRSVVARFEAERHALALMDHPNIARVLDAGTTAPELGSRPYFVMELVRGVPITQYCDDARLTPRERLEVLMPVCRAVQHAHTKGVIHRDLKPSNVLVTMHDGRPVPKVIDFGIAKATGAALTDKTIVTEFRAMIGTPAYMSPEQAEMSGLDIDIRSDIYSLGVLMYELLTGFTPFDATQLARAGLAEMQRIICEEEPPRPSTRVSTAGDRLRTIADQRRTPAERLGRFMRGELDWIVMKAMEKDRTRRYGTAEALCDDIGRYLAGEPVVAVPPSTAYRVRKFVGRYRGPVAAGLLLMAALLAGAAGTVHGLIRATRDRDAARAAEAQAGEAARAAMAALRDADAARSKEAEARSLAEDRERRALVSRQMIDWGLGFAAQRSPDQPPMTVVEMMTIAEERIGARFKADPRSESEARFALAEMLVRTGEFRRAERQLTLVRTYWETHGAPDLPTLISACDVGQLLVLERLGSPTENLPWLMLMQRSLLADLGRSSPELASAARAVLEPVAGVEAVTPEQLDQRVESLLRLVDTHPVEPGTLMALVTGVSWSGMVVIVPPDMWPLFNAYARAVERLADAARARGVEDPMLTMAEYATLSMRGTGGVAADTVERARAVLARARKDYAVGSWPLPAAVQGVADAIQLAGVNQSSPELIALARSLHVEGVALQRGLARPSLNDQMVALTSLLRHARVTGDTSVIDEALGPLPEGMSDAMARLPANRSEFKLVTRQHIEDLIRGYEALRARGDSVDRGARRLMGIYGAIAAVAALRGTDDAAIAEPMVRFVRLVGGFVDDLQEPPTYAQVHMYTSGAAFAAFVPDEEAAREFAARVRALAAATGGSRESTVFNAAFQPYKARFAARGDDEALKGWEGVLDEAIAAGPADEMTDDIALELTKHFIQAERWEDLRRVVAKLAAWYADPAARMAASQRTHAAFRLAMLPNSTNEDLRLARTLAERAVAQNAEPDRELLVLGIARTRLGDHAGAVEALTRAEQAALANPRVQAWTRAYTVMFRARAWAMLGRSAEAEADLRRLCEVRIARAARANPFPTFARRWLDEGLDTLGPNEGARLRAILDGWKLPPSDLNRDAWQIVARTDARAEDVEKALAWAREAASLVPKEGAVLNTLGVAQYRAGRFAEAIASLAEADRLNTDSPRGRQIADVVFLALAHHRLGQADQASAYALEARRLVRAAGEKITAEDAGFIAELDQAMPQR